MSFKAHFVMSFKAQVVQDGENKFVLPRIEPVKGGRRG